MAKKLPPKKASGTMAASKTKVVKPKAKTPVKKAAAAVRKSPVKKKETVDPAAVAKAKKMEALDAAEPKSLAKAKKISLTASGSAPQRNSDFPNTFIKQIDVNLNDPDHSVTLTWTGPQASAQETGPFRSSPGAGLRGFNCNDTATSRRSGSLCTPKGTFAVQGFASHLNTDARAVFVTWFVRARGIAFHFFPSVPRFAASHGCVRLEKMRIAQLIQSNTRVDLTKVIIDGTWTKPAKQY